MTHDGFLAVADEVLARLADRFRLRCADSRTDAYGAEATYTNMTTGVRVRYDARERRVTVSLYDIRRRGVPVGGNFRSRMEDPLNGFDVNDLVALRSPERRVDQRGLGPSEEVEIRRVLGEYAGFLEDRATDLFEGDFAVFSDLAGIVARRIRQLEREGYTVGPDSRAFLAAYEREVAPAG